MTLIHHWAHNPTASGAGFDIVITNAVQLVTEKGFSARAALGEAEIITVIVDDPTAIYDFKRLHRWVMIETATAGAQYVWHGYIGDQHISRGDEGETLFPTGVGRRWHLDIVQENSLLGFRVVSGTDGNRPAETPGARLLWLLSSNYLNRVFDHGLIDWTALNAFPAMDKADLRPQTAGDVLRDISLVTGFNHYARYRDASSDIEFAMYDMNTSTLDSSTLRVSNVPADVDFALTWPPSENAQLDRKGDRVASGMVVAYPTGFVYGRNLATSDEFGPIDMVAPTGNIKTQAAAERLRDRLLIQHSKQDERIVNLRLRLPAANVNDVKHGQLIQAKFVHIPGWDSFRRARVISKTFGRPDNETQSFYDVDLELSPQFNDAPFLVAGFACSAAPSGVGGLLWPAGWTQDIDYLVTGPNAGYPGQHIYVAHGPAADSVTVTATISLSNSYSLMVFEVLGSTGLQTIAGKTRIGTDNPASPGPAFDFPSTTTIGPALLIAWLSRRTSASPWNQPASGWTDSGFWQQDPLGDRQLVNAESRIVSVAGTYTGLQSPEGVEGGNTAGVVVAAYTGAAVIGRKGHSGIIEAGGVSLTVTIA